jgi:hypothetical protein
MQAGSLFSSIYPSLNGQSQHEIIFTEERTEPPHYFCRHTVLPRYLWPKLLADKVPGATLLAGKVSTCIATLFTDKESVAAHCLQANCLWPHGWQAKYLWLHTVDGQSICGCTLLTGKVPGAALLAGKVPMATLWQAR